MTNFNLLYVALVSILHLAWTGKYFKHSFIALRLKKKPPFGGFLI